MTRLSSQITLSTFIFGFSYSSRPVTSGSISGCYSCLLLPPVTSRSPLSFPPICTFLLPFTNKSKNFVNTFSVCVYFESSSFLAHGGPRTFVSALEIGCPQSFFYSLLDKQRESTNVSLDMGTSVKKFSTEWLIVFIFSSHVFTVDMTSCIKFSNLSKNQLSRY